ncbi:MULTISPECIES: hypothetical protein [Heyndrickxia]|nr:hypothetical protein [Heyndrickxia shackletonii]MBB2482855.1 hypothetical protein [Bacillus sp. APMAM]NEZ00598.1 hypothetical protein [Heyndrickxia shackletonii]RTZ53697.1 hypothetical protein EKO25_21950 [Bacillus sp. SAJ1]
MFNPLHAMVLNLFLYFPEDKREYIPAFISLSIFAILAVITFIIILKVNKKQLTKAQQIEEKIRKDMGNK